MATETHTNLTVATKLPEVITRRLSKPHLLDHKLVLPADDATYLPQIIVQPDVLRVLPQAVFPPLRSGAATGPAAAKSEREREDTREWKKIRREGLGQEPEDIRRVCSRRSESTNLDVAVDAGASWRLTSPWETAWQVTGQRAPKGQKP